MSVVLVAMDFVLVAMDVVLVAMSVVSDLNLHRDDKRRPESVSAPSSKGEVIYHLQTTFDDLGHSDRKSSLYAAIRRAASGPSRLTREYPHRDDKRRPELVSTPSSKGGVLYHLQTTFDDLGHSDRKSSLYAAIRRAASDPSRMTRDMRPSSTAASSKPLIGLLRGIRPVRAPVVPGS